MATPISFHEIKHISLNSKLIGFMLVIIHQQLVSFFEDFPNNSKKNYRKSLVFQLQHEQEA